MRTLAEQFQRLKPFRWRLPPPEAQLVSAIVQADNRDSCAINAR